MTTTKRYLRRCGFCRQQVRGLCTCLGAHEAREREAAAALARLEARQQKPTEAGKQGRDDAVRLFEETRNDPAERERRLKQMFG